ncbi:MAG: Uma2 family endonuclease [Gemmatimonadaceae bacterium]|nr:Uma2 family endonuclease [Gloeobacterales cyanobacterium ES-bin-141]
MGVRWSPDSMQTQAFLQDTWVRADWDHFLVVANDPALTQAKFYYNHGWMRVEMSPVGPAHAGANNLISQIVSLYAYTCSVGLIGYVNPTLRKVGLQEAQPDLAYYLVGQSPLPSWSNSPIDLRTTAAPALVVEVSATTLEDDLTAKRELYGRMGVEEYWVVDTAGRRVLLFAAEGDAEVLESRDASRVLPGLTVGMLAEVLQLGVSEGDAAAIGFILQGR